MKNKAGSTYYGFKKYEAHIIRKLDGPKRPTRVECDRQDIPRHSDINAAGRCWTF